jgi:hypothetical protein
MAKRAADYYRAAVGVMLRRIMSNMMLGITVDLSLSWLSMYISSSMHMFFVTCLEGTTSPAYAALLVVVAS